jgi:hypothetical protein
MRERDRELIAALAEGRLEDEAEARALLESSPEARAELETQRRALAALTQLGSAAMTETEKAVLHRDLWTLLRTQEAPHTRSATWLNRWSLAAAGLLLVVGVATVFSQGGLWQASTAADGVELETVDEAMAESVAGATASTEASAQAERDALQRAPSAPGVAAPDVALLAEVAGQIRAGDLVVSDLDYQARVGSKVDTTACLVEAGLTEHTLVGDLEAENHYLIAVPEGEEIGPTTPVFFVETSTCTLVYVDE